MTVVIRSATRTDRAAVVRVLGRAFVDDPVYRWLLPDPAVRARRLPGLMRAFLAMHDGGCDITVAQLEGRVAGVAMWDRPGHVEADGRHLLRGMPGMLRAVGVRGMPRLQQLGSTLEAARPAEPHHYLFHLGADPDVQGRGVGADLLAAMGGSPAYLECKPALVPYYARAGFAERSEVIVEPGALAVVTMWRS